MNNKDKEFNFYSVDLKYIRELAKYDDNVMSISPQRGKSTRPFLGIITIINNKQYCIPLTSPKDKFINSKSNIDFIKIFDDSIESSNRELKIIGILNINNMIPVNEKFIRKMNLKYSTVDNKNKIRRYTLLINQLDWCRKNMDVIINRANKVYIMVTETPGKSRNLTRRCCDFKKLEEVSDRYLHKNKDKEKSFSPLSRKTIQRNAKLIKNNSRTKNKNRNKNYDRNK